MAMKHSWLRVLFIFTRCRFWHLMTSLVLAIVFLQLFHMALLSRLEAKEAKQRETRSSAGRQLQGRMFKAVISEIQERVRNSHRLDKSGTYHLLDNILTSEHVVVGGDAHDVSVVTQCSSGHLHRLAALSRRWNGPVSVAVFTYDDDFVNTVALLVHSHFCNDHVYRHVSFHLAYPLSRSPKHLDGLSSLKLSCGNSQEMLMNTAKVVDKAQIPAKNYEVGDLAYPNNLLRNLAVNYAQTPYILTIDADLLPSANLRTEFRHFMSTNPLSPVTANSSDALKMKSSAPSGLDQTKSAYVVPVFELSGAQSEAPSTKQELLKLWGKGLVRPFYVELCKRCQYSTDYALWRTLKKPSHLSIAYSVTPGEIYEPFYIAKTSLPLYDERFKQYGFNRISQVCEMHVAGFHFHVLDNAFLVHTGFKVKDALHEKSVAENRRNKLLFKRFKEELRTRYPEAKGTC